MIVIQSKCYSKNNSIQQQPSTWHYHPTLAPNTSQMELVRDGHGVTDSYLFRIPHMSNSNELCWEVED